MDSVREVTAALSANGGILCRSDRPELGGTLDWLVRQGKLAAVLPGVYSVADWRQQPTIAMRAALLSHPDGVLIGAAAAKVSYWPSIKLDRIEVAVPRSVKWQQGFSFSRRLIPADLVVERRGLRYADAALTAVDYVDIAFRRHRLALKIDGRIHEDNPGLFESDRWRQNALVFAGWRVLRFTWAMLDRHPEHCVATVRRALP